MTQKFDQMLCWEISYEVAWPTGSSRKQKVTELLLCTPTALLHYKITEPLEGGRRRIFTDVQAMGSAFYESVHQKMRGHQFWKRMERTAAKERQSIKLMPFRTHRAALDHYGLEELCAADEKARNAWLTTIGAGDSLSLEQIMDKAKVITAQQLQTRLATVTRVKAKSDDLWGVF